MQLIEPSSGWRAAFLELAQEWLDAGSQRYACALSSFESYLSYLQQSRSDVGVLEERVPCAHYWLEDAGTIVACLRLRYRLTRALELEGGHIGYDVRPSLRRRGYGTRLLGLGLEEARSAGIDPVCVTTDSDNLGSIRVIEKNGGQLAGESQSLLRGVPIRQYWIRQPRCRW